MKPTGATKEAMKFTFEVVTGRHKIYRGLDQIATADDSESAQLIIDALNERERLREALRLATQINVYGDPANLAAKEAADAVLNDAAGMRG